MSTRQGGALTIRFILKNEMFGGEEKSVNLADHLAQVGAGVVAEGGGGLQHVVEDVAVEHQALLGLQPVGPGEAEGDGLHRSRLRGDRQTVRPRQLRKPTVVAVSQTVIN